MDVLPQSVAPEVRCTRSGGTVATKKGLRLGRADGSGAASRELVRNENNPATWPKPVAGLLRSQRSG